MAESDQLLDKHLVAINSSHSDNRVTNALYDDATNRCIAQCSPASDCLGMYVFTKHEKTRTR